MIPLAHDFTEETVLVFGGGSVGARKARHFAVEADVVVLSPAFVDADFGDAERVAAAPEPDGIEDWIARSDPALVVAATDDPAVNDAAAAAAREHGALVNRADRSAAASGDGDAEDGADASDGNTEDGDDTAADGDDTAADGDLATDAHPRPVDDVAVPATVREDPVVVSVSTGGTSPALAKELRRRVEAELEGAGEMAAVTGELRERLRAEDVDPAARREAVRAVARSPRVWKGLRSGDANVDAITEELLTEVLGDPQMGGNQA